jgi:hypothetical protein
LHKAFESWLNQDFCSCWLDFSELELELFYTAHPRPSPAYSGHKKYIQSLLKGKQLQLIISWFLYVLEKRSFLAFNTTWAGLFLGSISDFNNFWFIY